MTLWTVAYHALLHGIFLTQEIEPVSVISPALADRFFATGAYTSLIFFKQILV